MQYFFESKGEVSYRRDEKNSNIIWLSCPSGDMCCLGDCDFKLYLNSVTFENGDRWKPRPPMTFGTIVLGGKEIVGSAALFEADSDGLEELDLQAIDGITKGNGVDTVVVVYPKFVDEFLAPHEKSERNYTDVDRSKIAAREEDARTHEEEMNEYEDAEEMSADKDLNSGFRPVNQFHIWVALGSLFSIACGFYAFL